MINSGSINCKGGVWASTKSGTAATERLNPGIHKLLVRYNNWDNLEVDNLLHHTLGQRQPGQYDVCHTTRERADRRLLANNRRWPIPFVDTAENEYYCREWDHLHHPDLHQPQRQTWEWVRGGFVIQTTTTGSSASTKRSSWWQQIKMKIFPSYSP